jgi:hypothetical protein
LASFRVAVCCAGTRFSGTSQTVKCTTSQTLAAKIRGEFAFDYGSQSPLRPVNDGEASTASSFLG